MHQSGPSDSMLRFSYYNDIVRDRIDQGLCMALKDKSLSLASKTFHAKSSFSVQAIGSILELAPSFTWFIIFVSSATSACAQLLNVTRLLSQCAIVPSSDMISCWRMAGLMRLQNLENWSLESLPCLRSSISRKVSTMGASARSCSSRFQRSRICSQQWLLVTKIVMIVGSKAASVTPGKTQTYKQSHKTPVCFASNFVWTSQQNMITVMISVKTQWSVQQAHMLAAVCFCVPLQGRVRHSTSQACMV